MRTRIAAFAALAALAAGCSVDGTAERDTAEPPAQTSTSVSRQAPVTTYPPSSPNQQTGDDGAFRVYSGTGAPEVTVTVIEDLACPACAHFEDVLGETLDGFASDPEVAVDYQVISFLDRVSTDRYSSRAANASYCVWHATNDARVWRTFQKLAYQRQPAEGGAGLTDSTLADIATQAGAGNAAACIADGRHAADVARTTENVTDDDFRGTPTILIDGDEYTPTTAAALTTAVNDAKRD